MPGPSRKIKRKQSDVRASSTQPTLHYNWRDPLNLEKLAGEGSTPKSNDEIKKSQSIRSPSLPPSNKIFNDRDPLGLELPENQNNVKQDGALFSPVKKESGNCTTRNELIWSNRKRSQPNDQGGPQAKRHHHDERLHTKWHNQTRQYNRNLSQKKWARNDLNNDKQHTDVSQPGPSTSNTGLLSNDQIKKQKQSSNRQNKIRFRYGNYDRYYGKRMQGATDIKNDSRFQMIRKEFIEGKDILDIGCNDGTFTMAIACELSPKSVLGIDIDDKLANRAKSKCRTFVQKSKANNTSLPACFIDDKVHFIRGNYVLRDDNCVAECEPQYDTIIALSITKWIHVNWGDEGLKRFFKRVHKELRPGGRFLIEAQPWSSYDARKCTVLPYMLYNYQHIRLRPDKFVDYLMSPEVGFVKCENLNINSKESGLDRPVRMLEKADVDGEASKNEDFER